jgi:hypothetical protein
MVPVATKFPLSLTAKAEYVNPKLEKKEVDQILLADPRG